MEDTNSTAAQRLAELQQEVERLSVEMDNLETPSNSDALKSQLREACKDAKVLSKQRKKLQAMANIDGTNEEVISQYWPILIV